MQISWLDTIPFNESGQNLGPATCPAGSALTLTQMYLCSKLISPTQEMAIPYRETVQLSTKFWLRDISCAYKHLLTNHIRAL
jgi:hypothetical protein